MLIRTAALTTALVAVAALGVVLSPPAEPATGAPTHLAVSGHAATIGALFTVSGDGVLGQHFCTASVVDSPAGDLVLTAAHCLSGQSAGQVAFVPDYTNGEVPFGIWIVTRIVVDGQWSSSGDPDDDFAFLIVSQPGGSGRLQALTGGESVGIGEGAGSPVDVAGYPDSQNGIIDCQNTALVYSPSQFEFNCDGFTNGTSGSPLLADVADSPGIVIGVIGGHEEGGDLPSVSYAARFGRRMAALYRIALAESGPGR
jgi:V8-like Glu-specific endopeptidase